MGVTVNLPNNLTNGTNADAGQVMANLNALVNGLTNAVNTSGDTLTGSLTFPNGSGIVSSAGSSLKTGGGGGTWITKPGISTAYSLQSTNYNGDTIFTVGNGTNYRGLASYNNTLDDGSGNATFTGTVTANGVQLGGASDASGVWTPANGTFNKVAGSVINVVSIPSNAKSFMVQSNGVSVAFGSMWGFTTPSNGSAWWSNCTAQYGGGNAAPGNVPSNGSTTVTGQTIAIYDGTYLGNGYFQVVGGYLQFVITSSTTSAQAQETVKWAVS